MQRVQRKFGKLLKRSANEADIEEILKEFNTADTTLALFIEATKSWRNAWDETLRTQLYVAESLHTLYKPIEVEADPDVNVRPLAPTPKQYLNKSASLQTVYANLAGDLTNEVNAIETKLLGPATEARKCLKALKKTIKQREDCKLDYERYNSRVESSRRKEIRSAREETALMKHETDLAQATADYQSADEHLKKVLPPVMEGISILLPDLLATQIMIQHSLVGQLYTVLHEYCQTHRLPSPAPPMGTVVSTFEIEHTPIREEIETNIKAISSGKAIHQPMSLPDKKEGSITGLGLRNSLGQRKLSSQGLKSRLDGSSQPQRITESAFDERDEEEAPVKPPRPDEEAPMKPPRPGGSPGIDLGGTPRIPSSTKPFSSPLSPNMYSKSGTPPPAYSGNNSTSSTPYLTPSASRASLGSNDYFGGRERKPSTSSMASSIAAKKKAPPPPPKPKRLPSAQSQYVTAIYAFAGQNAGDLAFQEGERIRVLKKTDSTDDWWEGELRGVTGSFPANYVQVG